MPGYRYIARDEQGQVQRGLEQSDAPSSLNATLRARGLKLVKYEEQVERITPLEWLATYLNPFQYIPPPGVDIEVMLSQVAVMLRSGVTLLAALRTCQQQARFAPMRRMVGRINDAVQDGQSLADAFEAEKRIPQIAIQMTRVGELTGNLDTVLDKSAKALSNRRRNLSQTITALAYPAFVTVAAIGVAIYMVVIVIPEIKKALDAMGRKLPGMTQTLLNISDWIQVNGAATVVIGVGVILAIVVFYLWPPSRFQIDRFALRVPLIGHVLRVGGTVTFASSLQSMLSSGITVVEALRTVEKLHYNRFLASRVAAAREAVIAGDGLAPSLAHKGSFTPMLASMVAVAEDTGQMEEVLQQVNDYHDEQLQMAIKRLSLLVEPLVVIFVGGIVGFVYISFFLALFSASGGV
ncbi:MAG: type II secretion system F family protein [Planctomycetota bacterium]